MNTNIQSVNLGPYSAVVYGSYNSRTGNYEFRYDDNHITSVSGKKVVRTLKRLQEGHSYVTADAMLEMNRDEAAYLLANADRILKEVA